VTQSLDMRVDTIVTFRHFIEPRFSDHLTKPRADVNDKCNIIPQLLQTYFILTSAPSSTKTIHIVYYLYAVCTNVNCFVTWYVRTELSKHHTDHCNTNL